MRLFLAIAATLGLAAGATLEWLSTDDLVSKSTLIVRGKITGSAGVRRGNTIYTVYNVQVSETFKGQEAASVDVYVPGGVAGGFREVVPGAPGLAPGGEYVLFLWAGKSGITQIIGLSQGLFTIGQTAGAQAAAVRPALTDAVQDSAGRPVTDRGMKISLTDLRQKAAALGAASK